MPTLTLIKHSQPAVDPSTAAPTWRLSPVGVERCTWLAAELARYQIDRVWCSEEPKARETAALLAGSLDIPFTTHPGLAENDRTGFGYIHDGVAWEQRFRDFFARPTERCIGLESAADAAARFTAAIETIAPTGSQGNTAIVAHGTVITLFVANHNAIEPFDFWQALQPLPAYVVLDAATHCLNVGPVCFTDAR